MAEYIEKHKVVNLLTALENECQQFKPFEGFEHAMYRKLCETEIAIGKLPAADVVPVVHGVWLEKEEETYCPVLYGEDAEPILHKYTRYICNLCGRSSTVPEPYCHCGAKMDDEPIPFAEIDETWRKYEAFCREKGYDDE